MNECCVLSHNSGIMTTPSGPHALERGHRRIRHPATRTHRTTLSPHSPPLHQPSLGPKRQFLGPGLAPKAPAKPPFFLNIHEVRIQLRLHY